MNVEDVAKEEIYKDLRRLIKYLWNHNLPVEEYKQLDMTDIDDYVGVLCDSMDQKDEDYDEFGENYYESLHYYLKFSGSINRFRHILITFTGLMDEVAVSEMFERFMKHYYKVISPKAKIVYHLAQGKSYTVAGRGMLLITPNSFLNFSNLITEKD